MASQNRNPRNSENALFKSLTRLLSGPISNYRRQNPRALKRQQLDKYQFKSAGGLPFKKSSNNPLAQTYANQKNNQNRGERYLDFEQMEYDPLINAALDVYASEMTTSSPLSKLLQINCPNEEIKGELENLYYNIMNIEYDLPELMVSAQLVPSKSEAKRLIEQGGVTLDNKKITDWKNKIKPRNGDILKIGKRKFARLIIK